MFLSRQMRRSSAALVIVLSIAGFLWAEEPTEKPKPKITISKETTYITEPLRPDGYPDYVAALNQRMSQGITPENNAAVLLQKAFGPSEIPPDLREKFFKQLGIDPLQENGEYFVDQIEMIKRWQAKQPAGAPKVKDEELEAQFDRAQQRPWTAKEFPIVAEWLEVNEKPLKLVMEASRLPKCYFPLLAGQKTVLIASLLPQDLQMREISNVLVSRAMLKTAGGNIEEAWQDLLACHRLARLTVQGFSMVDVVTGYALDAATAQGDAAFAHYARLTAKQAMQMKAEIAASAPMPDGMRSIDLGERLITLDVIHDLSKEGIYGIRALEDPMHYKEPTAAQRDATEGMVDWNIPLRMANQWYDHFIAANRIADRAKRTKAINEIESERKNLATQAKDLHSLLWDMLTKKKASEVFSPRIGQLVIAELCRSLNLNWLQQRADLYGQMVQTAFALAAFRADEGRYPQKLETLVPKYLAKVPEDTFAPDGAPLRFRLEGNGYTIWAVGLNGVDDGGPPADGDTQSNSDDYGLRPIPPTKERPVVN